MTTYRNTYYHKIKFNNGEKVGDENKPTKVTGKKHGTITSFISNPIYLGVGSKLPMDMCIDWMEMMSYLVDEKLEFIIDEYSGVDLVRHLVISKKPFSKLIDKFIPDNATLGFGPINFSGKSSIEETVKRSVLGKTGKAREKEEIIHKDIRFDFAFAYDIDSTEFEYDAFCNFTKTDEGGVHVDAVDEALCKFLQAKANDSMTDKQKSEYTITRNDVRSGMKLVVNLATNAQVQFMGNAKNKIQNEALKPILRDLAKDKIEEYFNDNPGKLKAVCDIIKTTTKARVDLQKMRSSTVKSGVNKFDNLLIENYVECNCTKNGEYQEIFLIEGQKSAAGAMVNARDPYRQAIFGFRGQTLNPMNVTFSTFMENAEWKAYTKVLGCGIGQTFDLKKCRFNRFNICADADIDGAGISVGLALTHAMYFPEIIHDGRLYKIYPPLYRIDNKDRPFIRNKAELVELYMKDVIRLYKLRIGSDYMNKTEFWNFLYDISEYSFILIEQLRPFYKVPVDLIEVAAASLVIHGGIDTRVNEPVLKQGIFDDQKFIRNFMQTIQKRLPEIVLHGDTLTGVANGVTTSLKINNRFVAKIEELIPIYQQYGFILGVKGKGDESLMTILDFCNLTSPLRPDILTRFKGLGECNADELWETVLNPVNRISVQLTMENIERDMEIFRKLKSNKPNYMRQRAEMVAAYKVKYADIDN